MEPAVVGVFVPILLGLGAFAMVFGIRYLQNKENVSMIEKGMNPKLVEKRPTPYRNLKWGLVLLGAGIGLFAAYLLDNFVFYKIRHDFDEGGTNVWIYFALIAIGGGIGLITSYRIEKKELLDKQDKE
ncbi:MAG TPA: DUF6249 domain-containing protein [Puia sp.]|jgi:hypothetical protein|nr:DUF6249 domain-containing protein [Puia sp.]